MLPEITRRVDFTDHSMINNKGWICSRKVNLFRQYIGNIFTVLVISGLQGNIKPASISLRSCMDAVGLIVLAMREGLRALTSPQALDALSCVIRRTNVFGE